MRTKITATYMANGGKLINTCAYQINHYDNS